MATELDPYQQNDPQLRSPSGIPGSTIPRPKPTLDPYQQNDSQIVPNTDDLELRMVGGQPEAVPKMKKNYGLWEAIKEAPYSYARSATNFGKSMWNAMQKPIEASESLVNKFGEVPSAMGKLTGGAALAQMTPDVQAMITGDHPATQQMIDMAKALGKDYQDKYGDYESIKRTMAEDPVRFTTDAFTMLSLTPGFGMGRAALTAALDRLPAAVSVPARMAGYAAVPSAAVSDALGVVGGRVIPGVARYIEDVRNPENALMRRTAEGQGHPLMASMVDAQEPSMVPGVPTGTTAGEIVPGSIPTAGQAAAGDGINATKFQALGQAATQRFPTEATAIQDQQNAARLAQIQQIGRTPADLRAAEATRNANADANYDAAGVNRSGGPASTPRLHAADPALMSLFGRPSMDKVLARAQEIAQERGQPFQVGTTAPATTTSTPVMNPDGTFSHFATTSTPATFAQYPANSLHMMKQAFDDLAYDPAVKARYGIGASQIDAIRGTRNDFIRWFETANPEYGHARSEYARESRPIDQMRVGQYLEGKLTDPVMGEDAATLRAGSFAGALDNATNEALGNANLVRATGQKRNRHIREVMDPDQMTLLQNINEDLSRGKVAEQGAKAAGKYKSALETAVSDALHVKPDGKIVNLLLGGLNNHVADNVGRQMLTPGGAEDLLNAFLTRQGQINNYSRAYGFAGRVNRFVNPYSYANRYPAIYNALGSQQDEQQQPVNPLNQ